MVLEEKYFLFLETSFNYIIRYLIVTNILSKSKTNSIKLKEFFETLNYSDSFVELFNNLQICSDVEKTWNLINLCSENMQKDFYMKNLLDLFVENCKEIILDNMILLNSKINLK